MQWIHLLSLIPVIAIVGGIYFVNRVTPYVLGLPFLLFWQVLWVVLTAVIMSIVYRFDPAVRKEKD
ncbi:hypothetical protein SRRS_06100 [Sporomusa rhizae]|uniref:DUF3311 domain-containing protein n=1 Tax=Sporomusa rhizae TaxID=357999 RepID=UPI00352B8045